MQTLSDKEKAVLRGVLAQKTYSQIAHDMQVTHETVKTYARRIRAKLGVDTKVGMALWAQEHPREL